MTNCPCEAQKRGHGLEEQQWAIRIYGLNVQPFLLLESVFQSVRRIQNEEKAWIGGEQKCLQLLKIKVERIRPNWIIGLCRQVPSDVYSLYIKKGKACKTGQKNISFLCFFPSAKSSVGYSFLVAKNGKCLERMYSIERAFNRFPAFFELQILNCIRLLCQGLLGHLLVRQKELMALSWIYDEKLLHSVAFQIW